MTNTEMMQALYDDMQGMKQTVSTLQSEVKKIKLVLENESNPNILIVAKGHLDLSRKLDEYIVLTNEVKAKQLIQDIYINKHETRLSAIS